MWRAVERILSFGTKSQSYIQILAHLVSGWPCISFIATLRLSFFICKLGTTMVAILWGCPKALEILGI